MLTKLVSMQGFLIVQVKVLVLLAVDPELLYGLVAANATAIV